MGGLNMNTYEVLNFPFSFCATIKKFMTITTEIDVGVTLLQPTYDP